MTNHSDRWQAVASALAARMPDVGLLDNASLIRRSGLSEPFVRGILSGQPRGKPRQSNLIKLCRAVQWTDNSIDLILAGKKPRAATPPAGGRPTGSPELIAVMAEVRRLSGLVAKQGAEIAKLRSRLDQPPPATGDTQP